MSALAIKDIVVVSIDGLGDQILTWPTMRALYQLYPDGLHLVLGEGMRLMFYREVQFQTQIRARFEDPDSNTFDVEALVAAIGPCHTIIHLGDWLNDSLWDVLSGTMPRRTVGLRPRFSEYVEVADDVHMFDRIFALAQRLEPRFALDDFCSPPTFSGPAQNVANRMFKQAMMTDEKFLFVHPETLAAKMWSRPHLESILFEFLDERPEYRVMVCTREPFVLRSHSRIHSVQPHLELGMALVGLADCFLGVDSCFLHAADLYRVPGVSLFGPTRPETWGFRFSQPAIDIDGRGAMSGIDPHEVLNAMLQVAPRA